MSLDKMSFQRIFEAPKMYGLSLWFFIIPPLALIFAPLFEWPLAYYQLLRIIVAIACVFVSYNEYKENHKNIGIAFAVIGILFNPFTEISFNRSFWAFLDITAALIWIAFLSKKGAGWESLVFVFILPVVIVVAELAIGLADGSSPLVKGSYLDQWQAHSTNHYVSERRNNYRRSSNRRRSRE